MTTLWNLAIIFVAPLLPVALLALINAIIGARSHQKAKSALFALVVVYLVLAAIAAWILSWEDCPDIGSRLMEKYSLDEFALEQAAKRHHDLDTKLARLNYDIRSAGTALEAYAKEIELERLVHGNWCYYSEFRGVDGTVKQRIVGDVAIERDPVAHGLALMGSFGTHTFRAQRLLMDGKGLTYDWVASDTSSPGTGQNGQTFLTFEEEDPETKLKRKMQGFYWMRLDSGLMARGDLTLVRRDQVLVQGSSEPIQRDCREILTQAGVGVRSHE